MKRLTLRAKYRLIRSARRELRKARRLTKHDAHLVRIWSGEEVVFGLSEKTPRQPPRIVCFDRNAEETLAFLYSIRKRLLASGRMHQLRWTVRRKDGIERVRQYIDFAQIDDISTSAALVLAAEYERVAKISHQPTPTVNIDEWKEPVFQRLWQLGFFNAVGIPNQSLTGPVQVDRNRMTVQFFSGSDASEMRRADEMLLELARFIDPENQLPRKFSLPLNSALSEAMVNVRMHAYPNNYRFQFKHIERWWITGSADRLSRTITIAIYDQGASIPVTFARLNAPEAARAFIERSIRKVSDHPFQQDGIHIEAAMKYGRSQSGLTQRGKGLPQMQEAIDVIGNGRLVILSRGGAYIYEDGRSELRTFRYSVGGTLIQWSLQVPRLEVT